MKQIKSRFFPRIKAHPDQASIPRRLFAFGLDMAFILIISTILYTWILEIKASITGEEGPIEQITQAFKSPDTSVVIPLKSEEHIKEIINKHYLEILKNALSDDEFNRAKKMTLIELEESYPGILHAKDGGKKIINLEDGFHFFQEFVIGYIYFILFFHFKGQTLGKRLLRLKIIDLDGKKRLGWYQSFERTHGYAASALAGLLGFIQVLWNKEGLTMHDQLAHTTVIKLPKKKKEKAKKVKKRKK